MRESAPDVEPLGVSRSMSGAVLEFMRFTTSTWRGEPAVFGEWPPAVCGERPLRGVEELLARLSLVAGESAVFIGMLE